VAVVDEMLLAFARKDLDEDAEGPAFLWVREADLEYGPGAWDSGLIDIRKLLEFAIEWGKKRG
jgi:hypothetical protein